MRSQILKLKAELKVLASNLKTVKFNTRRDQSEFDKLYPNKHEYDAYKKLRENEEFRQMQQEVWNNYSNRYSLYCEYRSKHIAYCMLRGRTLEQIEPTLKNENDPVHYRVRKDAMALVAQITKETNEQS